MPTGTNRRRLTLAVASALIVVAGAVAANAASGAGGTDRERASRGIVKVTLHGVDGSKVGWVTMRQTHGRVLVSGVARGLTPGFHGFHIHAIGLCEADAPAGPFTTAGGRVTSPAASQTTATTPVTCRPCW